MVAERKLNARRTQSLLQMSSVALLATGGLCLLPFAADYSGISMLLTGALGVLGMWCSWHRGLVLFTASAWITCAVAAVRLFQLVTTKGSPNIFWWAEWVVGGCAATAAAILSTSLHLTKHWRPQVRASRARPYHPVAPRRQSTLTRARARLALPPPPPQHDLVDPSPLVNPAESSSTPIATGPPPVEPGPRPSVAWGPKPSTGTLPAWPPPDPSAATAAGVACDAEAAPAGAAATRPVWPPPEPTIRGAYQ